MAIIGIVMVVLGVYHIKFLPADAKKKLTRSLDSRTQCVNWEACLPTSSASDTLFIIYASLSCIALPKDSS